MLSACRSSRDFHFGLKWFFLLSATLSDVAVLSAHYTLISTIKQYYLFIGAGKGLRQATGAVSWLQDSC